MNNHIRRIEALEAEMNPPRYWHQLTIGEGQSLEAVRRAYEGDHGPIAETDGLIVRRILVNRAALSESSLSTH